MKNIQIMGILNITPDSFSDGGEYFSSVEKAVKRTKQMLSEGADIIDIGGESTRPGSEQVSEEVELMRVLPVIESMRKDLGQNFPISIDTYKANVAREALKRGATIVNSIGGMTFDPTMVQVIKDFKAKIVIYHIKGTPKTMQKK